MKIEEVFCMCLLNGTVVCGRNRLQKIINKRRLHVRKEGQPVTSAQGYAVVMHYPDTFVKAEGRIMLMI